MRKRDNNDQSRGFDSGCVGVLFEIGVWVTSTIFVTLGGAMFIFGVLSFEPEITPNTVFVLLAVPVAVLLFLRIGRAILRDLRSQNDER